METCKLKFSFLIYLFFRCRRQSCRPCSLPTPCPSGRSPRRRTSPSRAEKPESLGELSLFYLVFLVLGRSPQRRTLLSRAEKLESLGKLSLYYLVFLVLGTRPQLRAKKLESCWWFFSIKHFRTTMPISLSRGPLLGVEIAGVFK